MSAVTTEARAESPRTEQPRSRGAKQRILMSFAVLASLVVAVPVLAQTGLLIGGSASNFGNASLRGGYTPDPHNVRLVSGASGRNSVDVSRLSLAPGCRGHVTRQPDYILNYTQAASFLRFYATSTGDTTLVINDAQGNWHCNDDSVGLNPMVDIANPPAGQYDIWVGSYRAGENLNATLSITELRSQHP